METLLWALRCTGSPLATFPFLFVDKTYPDPVPNTPT